MWRRARRLSCLGHMFLERRRPRLNASRYWGDNLYDQFDRYSPDARRPRGPARGAPPRSDRPRGPHCRLSRTPRIWRSAIMRPRRTVSMDIRYWGGNLRIGPNGGRVCRACNAANQRAPSRLRNPLTRIAHILRYVNYYATCPLPPEGTAVVERSQNVTGNADNCQQLVQAGVSGYAGCASVAR
jgi:hypothetical protein